MHHSPVPPWGGFIAVDAPAIFFLSSYNDGFTPDEKQKFLELTSTNQRITKSVESLRKVIELKQMTDEIKRIIGGNGNPRSKWLTEYYNI